MSEKIEQYFVNLYAMVQKYGTIFVTSDSVHYRDKESAESRCRQEMKLGRIVKYAEVKDDNFPETWEELDKLMILVGEERKAVETKPTSTIDNNDVERAEKALEKKRAGRKQKADK